MLNKTQQKILETRANYLKIEEKAVLIENFLVALETKLGVKIDRNESSNFYIMTKFVVDAGIDAYNLTSLINLEMLDFFDSNKFDGYLGSDYLGCRQALMQLGYFFDVKFYSNFSGVQMGQVQTVLLPATTELTNLLKNPASAEAKKVADEMLKIYPVGTVGYSLDAGAITVQTTAYTGQELSFVYYLASFKLVGLWVEYELDFENFDRKLNYEEDIKTAIIDLYTKKYGFIGKDFIINDFRGIIKEIAGIRDIKFYLMGDKGAKGAEITENIEVGNLEVLKFSDVVVYLAGTEV
jgi:hypothetical protein